VTKAIDIEALPYRACVGIALFNAKGMVWVGNRSDKDAEGEGEGHWWQMPQGGLDKGEDPYQAALRELHEETSVTHVSLIKEAAGWFAYDRAGRTIVGRALSRAEAEMVCPPLRGHGIRDRRAPPR